MKTVNTATVVFVESFFVFAQDRAHCYCCGDGSLITLVTCDVFLVPWSAAVLAAVTYLCCLQKKKKSAQVQYKNSLVK